MRTRNCELAGLGHPIVDALIKEVRKPGFQGGICGTGEAKYIYAHYLVQYKDSNGHLKGRTFNLLYSTKTREVKSLKRFEPLKVACEKKDRNHIDVSKTREGIEAALQNAIIEWLPDRQSRTGLQISLVGLHGAN